MKAVRKNLLQELISMSGTSPESLTASNLMNTFAPREIQLLFVALMNRYLRAKNKPNVTIDEMQPYHRAIVGCSYFRCTLPDAAAHPYSFPLVIAAVNSLVWFTFGNKIDRFCDLLRSLNGHNATSTRTDDDSALHFSPAFSHDRELEKFLCDAGGHT